MRPDWRGEKCPGTIPERSTRNLPPGPAKARAIGCCCQGPGSIIPGQFELSAIAISRSAGVFEEVGIGLEGEAGVQRANWAGWRCRRRRGRPGRWLVPQAAVLEDLADHVTLAGLNEGDDLHGGPAAGTAEGVGLIDAFDENGPAPEAATVGGGGDLKAASSAESVGEFRLG